MSLGAREGRVRLRTLHTSRPHPRSTRVAPLPAEWRSFEIAKVHLEFGLGEKAVALL